MTIPNVNDPRRFRIEWKRDNKGMTQDEYIDMRAGHVTADRQEATKRWFELSTVSRDATCFDNVFHAVRVENDQLRQIRGEISYVDNWAVYDSRAWS